MSDAKKSHPSSLPPLPDTVAAFRDKGTFTLPEQFYPADVIDAREALRAQAASPEDMAVYQGIADRYQRDAQAASVEPVPYAYEVPGDSKDSRVLAFAPWFHKYGNPLPDSAIPLFLGAPPARIPADVGALVVRLNNWRSSGESEWAMGVNSGIDAAVQITQAWGRTTQAVAASPATAVDAAFIRDVFMRNGFTIKPGEVDLKPYVYAAAYDLLGRAALQASHQPQAQQAVAEGAGDERGPWTHADTVRIDALARPGWELSQNNEPECRPEELWQVHRVSGGRNDREWNLIGQGETPRAAIDAALATKEQRS